ncbi:unnamed protein product [Chrysoparadoxa australica]
MLFLWARVANGRVAHFPVTSRSVAVAVASVFTSLLPMHPLYLRLHQSLTLRRGEGRGTKRSWVICGWIPGLPRPELPTGRSSNNGKAGRISWAWSQS